MSEPKAWTSWSSRARAVLRGLAASDATQRAAAEEMQRPQRTAVAASWDAHHAEVAARRTHLDADDVVGIACSGGGIRSAAFNLGALQHLAAKGVLQEADYLAAVSGGAYIAGAHSLVQQAATAAEEDVSAPDFEATPPYAPGSPEERHLRCNSSYLAPGWRGRVRLVSYLLLGALLTLLTVTSLLALVAFPAAALGTALEARLGEGAVWAARQAPLAWLSAGLVAAGLLAGLAAVATRGADEGGNPLQRTGALLGGAGVVLFLVVAGLPRLVVALRTAADAVATGSAADALTAVLGGLTAVGVPTILVTTTRIVGGQLKGATEKGVPSWLSRIPGWSSWVAWLVTPLVLAAGFLLLYNLAAGATTGLVAAVTAGAAAVLAVLYLGLDPTSSSMHTFYRRRLGTAFAVRRVPQEDGGETARERDYTQPTTLSTSRSFAADRPWPRLLVCAAANVSDPGATPTGRNAVPFVFADDWVGSAEAGYVPAADYEAAMGARNRLPTLLGAIAMSGAALSPSMGRMTSPAFQFLLGLANVRLGVWLPNPRYTTATTTFAAKKPRITWLLRELLGWNALHGRYLYVTDGGHYDNLGLVELLRRRCTTIYCFDASGDPPESFTTLAQTLALARSELGVEIPLRADDLRGAEGATPSGRQLARTSWTTVDFAYPAADGQPEVPGRLVYVKCRVPAGAPWDVVALYERDAAFPDHSTADQLYTEERFEAYRRLGEHLAEHALASVPAPAAPAGTTTVTTPSPATPAEVGIDLPEPAADAEERSREPVEPPPA